MAALVDTHAHLTAEQFAGEADAVVARARAAGVERVVTIGTDVDDSRAAVALAARLPGVYASVGIHPHEAAGATPEALAQVAALAREPRVVALGETGLDYHYDRSPRERQREAFLRHLELGRERDLPVVVHSREADADLVAILREAARGVRGVLHCFAGGPEALEAALEAGWHVSFSGMVTFRKYDGAELLRAVPPDRLLVETDSPYLAPVPHRGRRNEPAYAPLVARGVAALRGEGEEEAFARLAANARAFYRLPADEPR